MAAVRNYLVILTLLLLQLTFMVDHVVHCHHDEDHTLFQDINTYRATLNLTALIENKNAECFAEEISNQFKNKPCPATNASNTVSGTELQFSDYPNLLSKCNLNISSTRDWVTLPACVPNLVPSQVLTNFTQSIYARHLNDSKYVGVGIASENDWIVVVLTTNTDGGSVASTPNASTPTNAASMVSKVGLFKWVILVLGSIYFMFN